MLVSEQPLAFGFGLFALGDVLRNAKNLEGLMPVQIRLNNLTRSGDPPFVSVWHNDAVLVFQPREVLNTRSKTGGDDRQVIRVNIGAGIFNSVDRLPWLESMHRLARIVGPKPPAGQIHRPCAETRAIQGESQSLRNAAQLGRAFSDATLEVDVGLAQRGLGALPLVEFTPDREDCQRRQ